MAQVTLRITSNIILFFFSSVAIATSQKVCTALAKLTWHMAMWVHP